MLNLTGGTWSQVAASLPSFSVTDFRLSPGATFVRALGGDGSVATPYRITDIYGLQGLASTSLAGSRFVLANDINASSSALEQRHRLSIGSLANPFTGRFDGQGHRISGLAINRPGSTYSGLFGYNAGYVGNLNLVGGSVAGGSYTGALVATTPPPGWSSGSAATPPSPARATSAPWSAPTPGPSASPWPRVVPAAA